MASEKITNQGYGLGYVPRAGKASILNVQYLAPGLLLTRRYTAPWHLCSLRLRYTSAETEGVVDVIIAISADAGYGGEVLLV